MRAGRRVEREEAERLQFESESARSGEVGVRDADIISM